jgi:hypothetical protein
MAAICAASMGPRLMRRNVLVYFLSPPWRFVLADSILIFSLKEYLVVAKIVKQEDRPYERLRK